MKTTSELKTEGKIAIVGAGPAGLTLARILSRDGFNVTVYERDASSTARSQGEVWIYVPILASRPSAQRG